MKAAILSIGTELTRGELLDTNAGELAERMTSLGYEIIKMVTVDDDVGRIAESIRSLAGEVKVVVATGGLGPTSDDLTAEAAAAALSVELVRDPATLERIRQIFANFRREMPPNNEKQAEFPAGATILPNPLGTAPGFRIELNGTRFYFMPGVPREMSAIFEETIVRELAPEATPSGVQLRLQSFGLSESEVATRIEALEPAKRGVEIGYRASFPEIEVKILARGADPKDAMSRAQEMAAKAREVLGDAVYGDESTSFPMAVGEALKSRKLTLSIAESCTGGLVGAMLTAIPGSSEFLVYDGVVYSNAAKTIAVGVNPEILRAHGAVSAETAQAMAEGARKLLDAELALSITGIAGPGGGSDEKPVGTVYFGLARRGEKTITVHRLITGDRDRIRTLAAYIGLKLVKRAAEGRLGAVAD